MRHHFQSGHVIQVIYNKMRQYFSVLLLLLNVIVYGQTYIVDNSAQLQVDNEIVLNPWAGGLESGQYNTIDVDFDGDDDFMVFDRTANKINLFLNENGGYVYDPFGSEYFPDGLSNWVLLRDMNCDGRKDIFTSDPLGMLVYVNSGDVNQGIKWRLFNSRAPQPSPLLTKGFTSNINLQVNGSDIPAIDDIDDDGDLDILVFKFTGSSTVEFHKNLNFERNGNCDSLQFERTTQLWGGFQECNCGEFAFNSQICPPSTGGREEHQAGKSLLITDVTGDGNKDVLVGDESCNLLNLLVNEGDNLNPVFNSLDITTFDELNVNGVITFPAAFLADVNMDGLQDLIVAPNTSNSSNLSIDYSKSNYLFENSGSGYKYIKPDFLQNSMLDVGSNVVPAFYDYDNDGDLDLFLGGQFAKGPTTPSLLYLYKNVGDKNNPVFQLDDTDPFNVFLERLYNVKPQFADVDGDGLLDIAITATSPITGKTGLYFKKRIAAGFLFEDSFELLFSSMSYDENVKIIDINEDGKSDLLIGRSTGKLEYYKNTGTKDAPIFSLEDDTFYGFDYSPVRQNPALEIVDLNGDLKSDMLVTDSRGTLTFYSDFKSSLNNPVEGNSELIINEQNEIRSINVGSRIIPVAANIFNENKPAIVLGTGQGGMVILRNSNTEIINKNNHLIVYPNPSSTNSSLKAVYNKTATLKIINVAGQLVYDNIQIQANEVLEIPTSGLKEGLYILASDDKNDAVRFVITR